MQTLPTIPLFSLNILNTDSRRALEALTEPGNQKCTAAFVNAHCINIAAKDPAYRWALGRADYLLPDGSGLQMAAQMKGKRFAENLNGTDLFVPLCRMAATKGLAVYFFGSQQGVAAAAAAKAEEIAPGLKVAGSRHGFFNADEEQQIIDDINASCADIVLVALGVPRQDVWIARNRHRLDARLVLGVGAQFDFWSGRVSRAPKTLRKFGAEWLWRLAIEPRRMAKRYILGNPEFLGRAWFKRKQKQTAGQYQPKGKRALDVALSGAAIICLTPLMAAIAAAIRLESPGPVLFRQTRVGEGGKPFTVLKFRSMYQDAEARRAEVLAHSDRSGICFKAKNDVRVTKVGKVLRRFSLDELPQLFNIWKGDMAIVGPRPALPQEVAAYPESAMERLATRPGLTGLWQVSGRAEIGFDKMVEMDRAYVNSRSILLDLIIIGLTAGAVIKGRGAF